MKRICCLFLIFVQLFCVLPALAESDAAAEYYLQTINMNGETYSASDLGMAFTLTFNPDGTGNLDRNGVADELCWSQDGDNIVITVAETPTEGAFTDNGLVLREDDTSMLFTTAAPETVDLGNTVSAVDASAFNGAWNCTYIDMAGTVMGVSLLTDYWDTLFGSTDETVIASDGSVSYFGGDTHDFVFSEGQLSYCDEDNDLPTVSVELTDTGLLVLTLESIGLVCYCEPSV